MADEVPTVLIIEADQATRDLYQRELGRSFRVLAGADDREASRLLQQEAVQAVVLEPALPDNRGWDLLAAITTQPTSASIPVILCTSLDEPRQGISLGAAAYLVKPVPPAALRDAILRLLGLPEDAETTSERSEKIRAVP